MNQDMEVIRVETALTRYPMHRLAKAGAVEIAIQDGRSFHWEVSHNSKYGQPGPLAYKVDTLVVNRRIEAFGNAVPKVVRLGSLNDICRELDLADSGKNKADIKRALFQNASAFITAKVKYKQVDGTSRTVEFGDNRYGVIFTGEVLPDGTKADAIFIVLHDTYREVLRTALTRPLDYDYLKSLTPLAQRLYELLSFSIFAALKNGQATAQLSYAQFCQNAPQTRYYKYDQVKKQLYKLHLPHRKSGYLGKVEFKETVDSNGKPDWIMIYEPGPKARAEFETFALRKRGR